MAPADTSSTEPDPPVEIPIPVDPKQDPPGPESPQPDDPIPEPVSPEVTDPSDEPEGADDDPFDNGNFPV